MRVKRSAISTNVLVVIISVSVVAAVSVLFATGILTLNLQPGQIVSHSSNTANSGMTETQTTHSGNNATISGSISLSGKSTHGTKITFSGGGGTFAALLSGNTYQLFLPNSANYSVSLDWKGNFSWQVGTAQLGIVRVNGSSQSLVKNFQVTTPDSMINLSGSVSTLGQGTTPVKVIFTTAGSNYIATITNGSRYSLSVPNLAIFSTVVQWVGSYSWQGSTDQAASLFLNLPAGANSTTDNIQLQTPSSIVQVSGTLTLTGAQTFPVNITFSTSGGPNVIVKTNGTQYTATLPNFATYTLMVGWKGAYSWQSGVSPANPLSVSVAIGSNMSAGSTTVTTPNSVVTVSGAVTVSGSGAVATGIVFSANGIHINANVTGGKYSVQLPNFATFNVVVDWTSSSTSGTCTPNPNMFSVQLPVGVTTKTSVNWSC